MPALMLTKLYVPHLRPGHLSRLRLLARLSAQRYTLNMTFARCGPGELLL
jgi:hypothetical protein